jgi:diguanylate cyclase (GGDEF)-like protein/PAS domain S-box-containing protein
MEDKLNLVANIMNLEFKDLFRTIINSTHEYIYFKDKNSRFIYINDAILNCFNETKMEDVLGKSDFDFYPNKFAEETFAEEQEIIKTGVPLLDKEEKLIQPNKKTSWYKVSKYPLYNKEGELVGIWGISANITRQKNIEYQLEDANTKLKEAKNLYQNQSEIDKTTGLKNNRRFYNDISKAYARYEYFQRSEDKFCIAFIDLDNFKGANDLFGHPFGDFILQQSASMLEGVIRISDDAYRYGGDEFLITYKGIDLAQSRKTTTRIMKNIEKYTFKREEQEYKITISAGVACCSETIGVDKLIKLADSRLYEAKMSGKNRVV